MKTMNRNINIDTDKNTFQQAEDSDAVLEALNACPVEVVDVSLLFESNWRQCSMGGMEFQGVLQHFENKYNDASRCCPQ